MNITIQQYNDIIIMSMEKLGMTVIHDQPLVPTIDGTTRTVP